MVAFKNNASVFFLQSDNAEALKHARGNLLNRQSFVSSQVQNHAKELLRSWDKICRSARWASARMSLYFSAVDLYCMGASFNTVYIMGDKR